MKRKPLQELEDLYPRVIKDSAERTALPDDDFPLAQPPLGDVVETFTTYSVFEEAITTECLADAELE